MHDAAVGSLRLYPGTSAVSARPVPTVGAVDAHQLANRELIRPLTFRRDVRGPEPLSAEWYDEIERRRYARHGAWLSAALEFGRHPGESVLLLRPGLGTDAARYAANGTEATAAATPDERPDLLRAHFARRATPARVAAWDGAALPFADGAFDVVVWNALHATDPAPAAVVDQIFRVLKRGGKAIALFPARYDAGYWQDLVLPLQYLYWKRQPDPTGAPKVSARELRALFGAFDERRVAKRHLRRAELPHLWRLLPLVLLERLLGRVLVLKAFKPLTAARPGTLSPPALPSVAA